MHMKKVWPVVLRNVARIEILAFEHPLAGLQLVKGSIEPDETSDIAAVRELFEEAGVLGKVVRNIGTFTSSATGDEWTFCVCQVTQAMPEHWTHFTEDDGGHAFRFFWHPLATVPDDRWHPVFKEALGFLQTHSVKPGV
jgi:8-oxo-dGTP pyrophosphatase MutT (NUDIX family)